MGKSTRIPAITYLSTIFCAQYASSFQQISGVIDCQKSLQRNGRVRDEGSDTFLPPLWAEKYGRGAEIYPRTNQIEFTLADSFPNGVIPPIAQEALDKFAPLSSVEFKPTKDDKKDTKTSTTTDIDAKLNFESKEITLENRTPFYKRILRLAAKSEEQSLSLSSQPSLGSNLRQSLFSSLKLPSVLAITMVILGLVPPAPILVSVFISGYLYLLSMLAAAPKSSSSSSSSYLQTALPALPLQGHVPSLVSNPLGTQWSQSATYDRWLRLGVLLGLICPTISTAHYVYLQNTVAGQVVGSHVFMLCIQTLTERYFRMRGVTPLPIRILIPLLYNAARMGVLYHWMKMGVAGHFHTWGKLLGVLNGLYWSMNLFGFLIPIASLRYLRAHYFCVEASEVVVREGGDHNIGLLS